MTCNNDNHAIIKRYLTDIRICLTLHTKVLRKEKLFLRSKVPSLKSKYVLFCT